VRHLQVAYKQLLATDTVQDSLYSVSYLVIPLNSTINT